jgi:hypothetical protein
MNPQNITISSSTSANTLKAIVPLLDALSRVENNVSALAVRLNPIINQVPTQDSVPVSNSVTGRLHQVGDVLQYLLDNIEL